MLKRHEIDATYEFKKDDSEEIVSCLNQVADHAAYDEDVELSLNVNSQKQKAVLTLVASSDDALARILLVIGPDLAKVTEKSELTNVACYGPTPPALKSSLHPYRPTFAMERA